MAGSGSVGKTTATTYFHILPRGADGYLFLEGGPPNELGADPGRFPAGRIRGIATSPPDG